MIDMTQTNVILFIFCVWLFTAVAYTIYRKKVLTTLLSPYVHHAKQLKHIDRPIIDGKTNPKYPKALRDLSFSSVSTIRTNYKQYVPKISVSTIISRASNRSSRSNRSNRLSRSNRSSRTNRSTTSKRGSSKLNRSVSVASRRKSSRRKSSRSVSVASRSRRKSNKSSRSVTKASRSRSKSSKSSRSVTKASRSASVKGKSMASDYKNKMLGPMNKDSKYDNISREEREKQLKKDQQMRNVKRIPALIKKLSSGPAGLIILIIVIILENVLKLDVNDFDKCPRGESDLMSLPGYVRTIIGLVPNLGDLFDLIGNKLCFKAGCKSGYNKQDGLCYKDCRPGYQAVGPVCWKRCGNDIDVGALCRNRCRQGFREVAGVCWGTCPPGFRDDGAVCTKDLRCNTRWDKCKDRRKIAGRRVCFGGLITKCTGPEIKTKKSYVAKTYPKESYGRGMGQIPLQISMKPRKK